MRIGVKFSRLGMPKFISHLDVQSMFSRTLRRTGLPVRYSQGFNPHIVTSFASAMAVGLESRGEYMEFFTTAPVELEQVKELLCRALPGGFRVEAVGELEEPGKKLMALVEAAAYEVYPEENARELEEALHALLAQEHCVITKMRKGKTREMDIRPLILHAEMAGDTILLRLALSGSQSLSPFTLLETLARKTDSAFSGRVVRKELYTLQDGNLKALDTLFQR